MAGTARHAAAAGRGSGTAIAALFTLGVFVASALALATLLGH
ncbi:hypothetical protein [Micromonospora sonchi]|nr:hypothetical protein [Micromonospora sonchi]